MKTNMDKVLDRDVKLSELDDRAGTITLMIQDSYLCPCDAPGFRVSMFSWLYLV